MGEIRMYKVNQDWLMAVHVPDRALMVLGAIERANYDYSGWGTAQDLISGASPAVLLYEGRAIPFLACAFGDFVGRCKVTRRFGVHEIQGSHQHRASSRLYEPEWYL